MKKTKIGEKEYMIRNDGVLVPISMVRETEKIVNPKQIAELLLDESFATQEHFVVFSLDALSRVIRKHTATIGILNRSQVHPRETFRQAILDNAAAIIITHNHPSGELEASADDLTVTKRLVEVGKLLGIPVMDHLIVSSKGFITLREIYPHYF